MAGDEVKAARVYGAYRSALQASDAARDGQDFAEDIAGLPKWTDLPKKGSVWFAVCNAVEELLEVPKTPEPFDYPLSVPVERRRIADVFVDADGNAPATDEFVPETLPETLRIRAIVSGDLCVREFDQGTAAFNHAMRARIHGVDSTMLEWRLDPADVDAAFYLLNDATTDDAWSLMRQRYIDEGGELLLPMGVEIIGWQAAAMELFSEEHQGFYLVRCRSEALGTLKVGPARVGHNRIYEDQATEATEWDGRLAALASLVNKPLEQLKAARIEDTVRLWSRFQELKKKASATALSLFGAQRSMLSTGGPDATSTSSPSPNSK